jgi:ABC-2 type transport system permease protein
MTGAIFMETLRRGWRPMLYWGLALAFMFALQIVIVPDVDAIQQMADLMATLPPFLMQAFGVSNDMAYMATPEGYLAFQLFNTAFLIIFSVYGVVVGMNVTANDEDKGILDVVMSLPIKRERLVLERLLAYALLAIGVVLLTLLGTLLGIMVTPALAVDTGKIALGMLSFIPGTLLTLAFTAMVGTLVRRRGMAMALAAGFLVLSYFIDVLGRSATDTLLNTLRVLSYYSYFDGATIMQQGVNIGNMLVLLAATIVFAAVSIWAFQRRDIGV